MLILEDLYLGDVRPSERSFKRNSQYAKALDEVVKAGDALTDTLTEKQKEVFEEYMSAQREVNVLTDCETFIYAFRLAAKIMIDVLTKTKKSEGGTMVPSSFPFSIYPCGVSLSAKKLLTKAQGT